MGRTNKSGLTRKEGLKEYRKRNRAKQRELMRTRRAALTPEEKAEQNKTRNVRLKAKRAAAKEAKLAALTPEDIVAKEQALQEKKIVNEKRKRQRQRTNRGMLRACGEKKFGQCPICLLDKDLVCDHCHTTGFIRGWICDGCNTGFAHIGDTLESARRAVKYMETPL